MNIKNGKYQLLKMARYCYIVIFKNNKKGFSIVSKPY